MNTMLMDALDFVTKRECSIIPVARDKRPLVKWEEFQKRRPTEEEVESWWTRWPDANIAIVTGRISGLVVVDADGAAGLEWMKENLPVTGVYVQTCKGWHGYYRHPGTDIQNRVRIAPEVDIRAVGGYVVAPPSLHDSGWCYQFHFTPGMDAWDDLAAFEVQTKPVVCAEGLDLSRVTTMVSSAPVMKGQRNASLARLVGQWLE